MLFAWATSGLLPVPRKNTNFVGLISQEKIRMSLREFYRLMVSKEESSDPVRGICCRYKKEKPLGFVAVPRIVPHLLLLALYSEPVVYIIYIASLERRPMSTRIGGPSFGD